MKKNAEKKAARKPTKLVVDELKKVYGGKRPPDTKTGTVMPSTKNGGG